MSFSELENTNKASLKPDLGPIPRTKHPVRRRGICKCLCYAFTVFIGFITVVLGVLFIRGPWMDSLAPHKHLYQDLSNDTPHEIVHPLIDKDQKFDIVATVWIRDVKGTKTRDKNLVETVIFTDTIFSGIKMSDKNIRTSVNLDIPTDVLKDKVLADHDLRGSFVLVPNSPSPLDNVLNYSSWIPTSAANPPSRAYPVGYTRSLADEVVDAYGTFTPLLSFHNIKSKCRYMKSPSLTSTSDDNKAAPQGSPPFDNDHEEFDFYAMVHPDRPRKEKNEVTTKGKAVLEAHPYIITRTHLSIIDMTKLYNREAYEVAHKILSETECGELSLFGIRTAAYPPDWRLCDRSFAANGNHEVMIEYSPESNREDHSSNWAYAPYLFVDQNAWGPLDLVSVPVNREECAASSSSTDSSVLNVTWNVSFGRISPRNDVMVETMSNMMIYRQFNMTDNEEVLQNIHSQIEFIQSLFGPDFDQKRRPLLLGSILLALALALTIFSKYRDLLYWYNHAPTSTVGISIIGAQFSAGDALLDHLFRGFFVTGVPFVSWDWAWELFYESLLQVIPLLRLKAVTRAKFIWSKKRWIFTVPVGMQFAGGTHAERTSERVEARTSWCFRQLTFFLLAVTFWVSYINDFYVIAPKVRRPAETLHLNRFILLCQSLFVFPMMTLGWILQIIMNFRSRTFAGMDKLAAYSGFFGAAAMIAATSVYNNLPVDDVNLLLSFEVISYGFMALQALAYPKPSVPADTDDD